MCKLIFILFLLLNTRIAQAAETVSITLETISFPEHASVNENYHYQDCDTIIMLDDQNTWISGEGALYSDGLLTISKSGKYYLSGTLNGSILVDSPDDEKVTLVMNGVSITATKQSCIVILASGKNTMITLADNSTNLLRCALASDVLLVDGAYDAAIYSKAELKFKGTGQLYINTSGGKGINCRDDVTIQSCSLYISASDDGLRGKDSVTISSGLIRISAGVDGIRSTNEEKEGKGYITINDGLVMVESTLDGIQAYSDLKIAGGNVICITGGGAKENTKTPKRAFGHGGGFPNGRGGPGWDANEQNSSEDNITSAKGLKADGDVLISNGNIQISSNDDAVHADQNIVISGGKCTLTSSDDGIHADEMLLIEGGNILIANSYEGIEAADLQIIGGETRVYAADDGVNAAGGEKIAQGGSYGGRGGFGGGMLSASVGEMKMCGGYLVVNSSGDGVDVNGSCEMGGGTLIIYGPSDNGNAALDYDGVFTVSGGTLLATGSYGMAQTITAAENVRMLAFTCGIPAETLLFIADSSNREICAFVSPKSYSCVIFAGDTLKSGESYQVYAEGSYSTPDTDGIFENGEYTPGTLLGIIDL